MLVLCSLRADLLKGRIRKTSLTLTGYLSSKHFFLINTTLTFFWISPGGNLCVNRNLIKHITNVRNILTQYRIYKVNEQVWLQQFFDRRCEVFPGGL